MSTKNLLIDQYMQKGRYSKPQVVIIILFFACFFSLGVMLLVISINIFREKIIFIRGAKYTQGTVVDVISRYGQSTTGRLYGRSSYLIVEYKVNGITYRDRTQVSSGSFQLVSEHVGKQIGLYYDPNKPEVALIVSFIEMWFGTLVTGILAIAFMGIPACFMYSLASGHLSFKIK